MTAALGYDTDMSPTLITEESVRVAAEVEEDSTPEAVAASEVHEIIDLTEHDPDPVPGDNSDEQRDEQQDAVPLPIAVFGRAAKVSLLAVAGLFFLMCVLTFSAALTRPFEYVILGGVFVVALALYWLRSTHSLGTARWRLYRETARTHKALPLSLAWTVGGIAAALALSPLMLGSGLLLVPVFFAWGFGAVLIFGFIDSAADEQVRPGID